MRHSRQPSHAHTRAYARRGRRPAVSPAKTGSQTRTKARTPDAWRRRERVRWWLDLLWRFGLLLLEKDFHACFSEMDWVTREGSHNRIVPDLSAPLLDALLGSKEDSKV